jgi:hypothetical protein
LAADNRDAKSNTRGGGATCLRTPSVLFPWHDSAGEGDALIRRTTRGHIVSWPAVVGFISEDVKNSNGIKGYEIAFVRVMNALIEEGFV